jgi:hypothetical protein
LSFPIEFPHFSGATGKEKLVGRRRLGKEGGNAGIEFAEYFEQRVLT